MLFITKQEKAPLNLENFNKHLIDAKVESYPTYKGTNQEFNIQIQGDELAQKLSLITPINREIYIGDRLLINGSIKPGYNKSLGLILHPEIVRHQKGSGMVYEIGQLRSALLKLIQEQWHGKNAALLSGLMIGADCDYSSVIRDRFRNTLTMHIMVVSGFNIEFLHRIIMQLSVLLGRRKTYLFSLCVLIFYCLMVGIDNIPCQRALLMTFIGIIAKLLERRVQGFQLWGITLITILLINPNSVHELSLQLSFLASAGMLIAGYLKQRLALNWIIEGLMLNLLCNLFLLPILLQFGNIPTFGSLIANIFISPVIPLIIISGLLSIFTSLMHIGISDIFIVITDLLLDLIFSIVSLANLI